ncbi:MAG: GNAT family N-acetyltransferase [Planctomycetota bacterium]|jgi:ribosomal protein S18 acetylase RimI-like enzyme
MMMQGDYVIRKASTYDIPQIAELWRELMDFNRQFDEHWSRLETGHEGFGDFISGHISDEAFCILVAEADKDIVGYCLSDIQKCDPPILKIQEYGHISNIAVTRHFQRKGIGEDLLRKTVDWFSKRGIHRIEVCAGISNKSARKFWTKMGFTTFVETMFLKI